MTAQSDPAVAQSPDRDLKAKLHFAAWRWHFYAGVFVAPFLIVLATTGLIMLWTHALVGLNGERATVVVSGTTLAPSVLAEAAAAAVPDGIVTRYLSPLAADGPAVFRVDVGEAATNVVVDPYTGAVIEAFPWRAGLYDLATKIHGTLMIGTLGDRLIEIAAGFGLVLIVTGLYLWWPRDGGRVARLVGPDLSARGRSLWKSLHRTTGLWVAPMLIVFLISGMSWSGIWGERFVQAWSTFPAEKWDNVPLSDATHASMNHGAEKSVPWGLEQTPMPESGSAAGAAGLPEGAPVDLDTVAAFAQGLGLPGRFQIAVPADGAGVWTISHDSMSNDGPDPSADRTIHIDQYTGRVLADVGFADYSVYAGAMAYGIAFHEGDMGLWNLVLNTAFCLGVIFLATSGLVTWWIRRPTGAGRLVAPPMPAELPFWKGAAALAILISMAFPLVGLTLIAVLAVDALAIQNLPALRRALS